MNPLYDDLPLLSQGDELGPSIRLLRLRGTAPQVTNKLEVFLLQKCPKYKALSYCWGDAADTLPLRVQCNDLDFTLDITRNLHSALEHLQFEYPDQLLWIDAICINQQDKTEREHQVAIMRDIYSRAEEVLIWLGLSIVYGNAHLAFSACEKFVSLWRPYVHYLASRGMKDHNRIANVAVDMALRSRPFTGAESDALIEILRQPHWSRLWIIQEMCVPKAVRIHEGRQSISWDDFKLVLVMMERCMPWVQCILDSNFRALLELRRCYHEEDPATRPQLPELLALFRWSRATNKLDKIYGLLGLAPSHERDLVKIEYNTLPSKCYTRVMFALLQQRRDLSLLMDCKVPSFVCRQPLLPSWVPDWSYDASNLPSTRLGLSEGNRYHAHSVTHKGIYQGYQASGSSEYPMPRIRDDGNGVVLILHGMVAAEAIIQVAPAIGLHHQLLHVVKHRGLSVPVSPFASEESTNIHGIRFIWRVLTTTSISSFLMPRWNCYRRGAALDVLLASARLAQFPGTYLGEEKDILRVLFITMMKGPRGHEFIQDRVEVFHSYGVTQEMTNQFRNFHESQTLFSSSLVPFKSPEVSSCRFT